MNAPEQNAIVLRDTPLVQRLLQTFAKALRNYRADKAAKKDSAA